MKHLLITLLTITVFVLFVYYFSGGNIIEPAYTNPSDMVMEIHEDTNNNINQTEAQMFHNNKEEEPTETIFVCQHTDCVLITQKFASCKDSGIEMNVCVSCEEILEQFTIPQTDHIEVRGDMVNSTCISKGYIEYNCVKCGNTIRKEEISTTEHNYNAITTKKATPIENGYIVKQCKVCNKQITESVKWKNKYTNGIYIPKLNLYTNLTLGICNQEYTDKYDIICDYNFINENNPVLFGHNTRSLGSIYKLNSGDEIYIIRNGNVEAYRITVSELGLLVDGGTNIQGIDTGTKCISTCSESTLHVFTCYNSHKYDNARWIIIAKRFY